MTPGLSLSNVTVRYAGKPPPSAKPTRARGGLARAAALSPQRRAEIARKAATARWRP